MPALRRSALKPAALAEHRAGVEVRRIRTLVRAGPMRTVPACATVWPKRKPCCA